MIAGYSISNDVSERTYQLHRGGQWTKGKSLPTFNPLGPYLVTPDEVGDPQHLRLSLHVNGETRQQSSTDHMIFSAHRRPRQPTQPRSSCWPIKPTQGDDGEGCYAMTSLEPTRTAGLSASALNSALTLLSNALPDGTVVTDPDITRAYRHDSARDPKAAIPAAVVRPTCTAEVQTALRWTSAHEVPVVTRGAGTGLCGGASGVDGGVVISSERMRRIVIEPAARVAVAEPGAITNDVKRAAAAHGL